MAKVTVKVDGPYLVEGVEILDSKGRPYAIDHSKPLALCRCGASAKKPFCDGSHNRVGFKSGDTSEPTSV